VRYKMTTFARIHWVRVFISGFLAQISVFAFLIPFSLLYGEHSLLYAAPLASLLACFLFALWVGRRGDSLFVLHGALVGVVATLTFVVLTHGHPEAWPHIVAHALKILGGTLGGFVASRPRSRLNDAGLSRTLRDKKFSYKKALAIVSGLLAGWFLYERLGLDSSADFSTWKLYQGVALLGGIGLAGLFDEAWLIAVIGLSIAPTLIVGIKVFRHPAESMWPIALPMVFTLGFPAPLIGGGISRLLKRTKVPRIVYIGALTGALVVGAFWPNIQNAKRRKFETQTVPRLLKEIYDAEIVYRAQRPDGNFACDGSLLPGAAGTLGWDHGEGSMIKKYLRVQYYNIRLDCSNEIDPQSFRITASSNEGSIHAPVLSMNETGKLVVVPWPPKGPNTR